MHVRQMGKNKRITKPTTAMLSNRAIGTKNGLHDLSHVNYDSDCPMRCTSAQSDMLKTRRCERALNLAEQQPVSKHWTGRMTVRFTAVSECRSAKMWDSRRSRLEAEWLIPRPKRGTKHGEIRRRAREACYMICLHTDSHQDTCATGSPERTRRTS